LPPNAVTNTLSGRERLSQNERTASRVMDGKAIVITIDHNQLHVLNAVGTRVWQLADGRPIDAIVEQIVLEFAVDREQAKADVLAFAEQILTVGAACIAGHQEELGDFTA
jgi:hypothetical protein